MATKKAGGSSKNGRDSKGRRLGVKKYGDQYEGSILWTELIKQQEIKLIQDLTLKIPNCI